VSAVFGTRAAALALMLASGAPADSAEPKLPVDGWVSWEVAAVEDAPVWCCFDGSKGRNGPAEACELDERNFSFGSRDRDESMSTARVYARSSGGKLDRLQLLSNTCPVVTQSPVQELAGVTVDESARWLAAQVQQGIVNPAKKETQAERLLPALALHRGAVALDALKSLARSGNQFETRKTAVFWLALARGAEGADFVSAILFNDPEPEMRRHATFALSQSKSPRKAVDLIRLGKTDKDADVRSKAWFWLAQTGVIEADQAIADAVRKDPEGEVREQAVFALSQLPDERATRALIAAAEDQSLTREQRKRAVFWLSHSQSDAAQKYLDQVLARLSP
jgi:hypothetical protein